MFDCRFTHAKNSRGEPYREESGNLVEFCSHNFIAKIREDSEEQDFGGLTYQHSCFDGLELVCVNCGLVTWINSEDLISSEEFNKRIQEQSKEIELSQKVKVTGDEYFHKLCQLIDKEDKKSKKKKS